MKSPLHILHLEDEPNDAALVQSTLVAAGIACAITRVQKREDFEAALAHGGVDLILLDWSLPAFDGMSALKIAHSKWPAIPAIFVSGTLGEERAIDSLKSGATDYVLKERLARLVPAVRRAMQEVEDRAGNLRTEQALRETEQRLRIVFTESALGIALIGVDGRPVLTNAALQKMLGYTDEEMSGMPFLAFTHPDDRAKVQEFHQELVRGTRQDYQIEKRYIRKDGQVVWARVSVSMAREAADHAGFAIGMVEDITERRSLEAKFIEAQKMEVVGQLTGGVAHDFNNIMAVIMGFSQLAMERLGPNEAVQGYLETIRAAGEHAAGLTRQLLIFSRRQPVQPVVLDLNDVVKGLDKMLRRLIDENIALTIVSEQPIGHVKADSGYVAQVVMNLVVNARDAMPKGGQLTISTSNVKLDENYARTHTGTVLGDYVMFSVSDTGCGMTEEVKARLFEAFFTTKSSGKGTGLGLATCQTIIQQSGGYIDVCTEAGRGTTFKIYFPRVEEPLDLAARMIQDVPSPRGSETLLVVEDEPAVRHLARSILEAHGYEVVSASNGQVALQMLREQKGRPIRLVITDVVMPQMGGKELAEELRTTHPDLQILFTSGYTDNAIMHNGVLEEGVEFLSKPYTPGALACKVRAILDRKPRGNNLVSPKSSKAKTPRPARKVGKPLSAAG